MKTLFGLIIYIGCTFSKSNVSMEAAAIQCTLVHYLIPRIGRKSSGKLAPLIQGGQKKCPKHDIFIKQIYAYYQLVYYFV